MSASSYAFDAPDADVILRVPLQPESKGFKDFHTHKAILSIASTLFKDMFSIPQPPQSAEGDPTLPIIQISESAESFETFLRLIYPVEPPSITSLQAVDSLFRLAEKYMANGVHTRLKQILVSPYFLRSDPIMVYVIACRVDLNEEAELAIPHTFKIDLVRDISRTHLQTMTAEAYNRLLMSHATRRDQLISVLNEIRFPPWESGKCTCGRLSWFYTRLCKDMKLAIWGIPFLDRRRLNSCLSNFKGMPKSTCELGSSCGLSAQTVSAYFTNILDVIEELG